MGTRADFYLGRGKAAQWLGSIGWDGHPESLPFADVKSKDDFMATVKGLEARDDFTPFEAGWPWPWEDSRTTDYAYAWDDGVWVSQFGSPWFRYGKSEGRGRRATFPKMGPCGSLVLGPRSGILVFGGGKCPR
jgi:hypothetical protein